MTLQSCGFLKRSLAGLSGWVCGGTVPEFLLRAVGKSSPAAFTWKAGLVGSKTFDSPYFSLRDLVTSAVIFGVEHRQSEI